MFLNQTPKLQPPPPLCSLLLDLFVLLNILQGLLSLLIAHCYFMLQFTFPIIYVSYGPAHFQNP